VLRRLGLAALLGFGFLGSSSFGEGQAQAKEEAPTPGSWRKLAVRTFEVQPDADMDATLKDLPRLLRHFRPQGIKVTDLAVENEGPRHLPRVTFKATMHVDVDVGPVHVEKDEEVWVRADVTSRAGKCAYDANRLGFEVKLDLTASEEPVSANVQTMVAALCVDPKVAPSADPQVPTPVRRAELTSFMQVGPDYGTRVAGRLATNMLVKQTDPIMLAVKDSVVLPTLSAPAALPPGPPVAAPASPEAGQAGSQKVGASQKPGPRKASELTLPSPKDTPKDTPPAVH
jgi:hypothetical protein